MQVFSDIVSFLKKRKKEGSFLEHPLINHTEYNKIIDIINILNKTDNNIIIYPETPISNNNNYSCYCLKDIKTNYIFVVKNIIEPNIF